jgi:hypothetical protein
MDVKYKNNKNQPPPQLFMLCCTVRWLYFSFLIQYQKCFDHSAVTQLFAFLLIPSLATKDELSLMKALPIRVRIINICQEHLTGFNLIIQSHSTSSKLNG